MASQKPIGIAPLTGTLDLRSNPDEMPTGAVRMRQNLECVGEGKLRRGSGYQKLLSASAYNNEDFHDQLLGISNGVRQPPTLLFQAESTRKVRSLILATQGTIAQLNQHTGNWRVLGSGYGGTASTSAAAPRFKAAQVGDYVVFTNNLNKPLYHPLEQPASDSGELLYELPDLATINLTRAGVVFAWRNCLFLADVEMDGERFGYRLLWSDYDAPISFDPSKADSITGSKDLFTHETILAGMELGNSFLIYTTHGIWEMAAVGGEQSFSFQRVYSAERNDARGVLAYPNTLVNLGTSHAYMARDGVYSFTPYSEPAREEWLHRATAQMYEGMETENCSVPVAACHGDKLLISVARTGAVNNCPNYTLRINRPYSVVDVVDDGFTAFCQFEPQDVPDIRSFLVENGICTIEALAADGYGYLREGLPREDLASSAAFTPDCIHTKTTRSEGDATVEDWDAGQATTSVCALLAGARLDDYCSACRSASLLVAASSIDWCLKQLGGVFYRERCANPTAVGTSSAAGYRSAVGSYLLDPIVSILRPAAMYGLPDQILVCKGLTINYVPEEQTEPSNLLLRVGISAQPADSNGERAIVWFTHSARPLKYMSRRTAADHVSRNTSPADKTDWAFLREGRHLHMELKIAGVGGDAVLSGISVDIGAKTVRNY